MALPFATIFSLNGKHWTQMPSHGRHSSRSSIWLPGKPFRQVVWGALLLSLDLSRVSATMGSLAGTSRQLPIPSGSPFILRNSCPHFHFLLDLFFSLLSIRIPGQAQFLITFCPSTSPPDSCLLNPSELLSHLILHEIQLLLIIFPSHFLSVKLLVNWGVVPWKEKQNIPPE